ncbi:MAG: hypothetical protein Q4B50_02685, partial [Bacillota bacterium]|nr:hypothetical protein [Bacillota bacterium]
QKPKQELLPPAENNPFPLSEEAVSAALSEQGLDWGEAQESALGNTTLAYIYPRAYDSMLLSIQTMGSGEMQSLFLSSQYISSSASWEEDRALWPEFFALSQRLFGGENQAAEIFPGLADSITNGSWDHSFYPAAALRQGDLCYTLSMDYKDGLYALSSLRIENAEAHEQRQESILNTTQDREGPLDFYSIEEAQALQPGEKSSYFRISGYIEAIEPAEEKAPPAWEKAVLKKGEQSMEVLLQPHAFTEEELQMEREHVLILSPELPLPAVVCSPLPQ